MSSHQFERLREILLAVADLSEPERAAYLDDVCRDDPDLHAKVVSILVNETDGSSLSISKAVHALHTPESEVDTTTEHGRLAGRTLAHYRIIEKIGAGGMGEVYRARDVKLERDVAIKVLPKSLAADSEARTRFQMEARAVAALSHPGILAIHDFGEEAGISYAVTEFLDGQPLSDRLAMGPLPPRTAVAFAGQIAHGLAAAHDKGIIHCDLKPHNVFVTREERLKILDFGLALTAPPAPTDDMTLPRRGAPGLIMGTPAYMSPEQIRAQGADVRSDVFSFGAVLYEMLTGRKAFTGGTVPEVMAAVLHKDPEDLAEVARLAPAVEPLVRRCLQKDPDERFPSARDVALALEFIEGRLHAPTPTGIEAPTRSIAVLPFRNLSANPEQDYFCEGIADELIHALTGIEGLQVASRTSSFRFQDPSVETRQIGRTLHVTSLLAGSVRTAGKLLRVVAELINTEDGYRLWSERYERRLEDVFAIQDEIVEGIVNALRVRLGPSGPITGGRHHTANVAAYRDYLRGLSQWYRRENDSLFRAARYFEQAAEKDPTYALAYVGAAESYASLGWYGMKPDRARSRSRAALDRAIALDSTLAEVQAADGLCKTWLEWDWAAAEQALRMAIELKSTHARAMCWLAFLFQAQGRFDESCAIAAQAQALEPVSPYVSAVLGSSFSLSERHDEALAELHRGLDIAPDSLHLLWNHGAASMRSGHPAESIASLERAVDLSDRSAYYLAWLGWAYGNASRRDSSEQLLQELQARSRTEYVAPALMAWILGALGQLDEAFALIEQAYRERSPLLSMIRVAAYDPLRSDPRYDDLRRRMRLI